MKRMELGLQLGYWGSGPPLDAAELVAEAERLHFDVFARMGYEGDARIVQEHYLAGRKDEAAAAVPTSLVEDIALVGPAEKVRDDLAAWQESMATTLLVSGDVRTLRTMAELVL